jgi:hypothetical protein
MNLSNNLWNEDIKAEYENKDTYNEHILEQYKLYVEMADRISSRRDSTNTFFLTLNIIMLSILAFCIEKNKISLFTISIVCLSSMILCYVWKRLLLSYKQLNTGKYIVVGELEKKLPASPYWSAEWKVLGEGKDSKKYKPLTHIEKYIPMIFLILYFMTFVESLYKMYFK